MYLGKKTVGLNMILESHPRNNLSIIYGILAWVPFKNDIAAPVHIIAHGNDMLFFK